MARWRGGVSQLSGLCFGEELFEASYLEGGSVARVSGQHKKPTSRIKDTRRFWRGGVGVHARHVARGPLALQSRRGRGFSGPSSSVHSTQQTEQFESSLPRALHALGGQWWVPHGEKANFQRDTGVFGRGQSLKSERLASCPSPCGNLHQGTATYHCVRPLDKLITGTRQSKGRLYRALRTRAGASQSPFSAFTTKPLSLAEVAFCQMSVPGYFYRFLSPRLLLGYLSPSTLHCCQ